MLTEDYLIRRINQALALLLHAIGLRKNGQLEAALTDIDIALELLLGMRAVLLKGMDDASLLQLLTVRGQLDIERLALVARLYKQEAAIYQTEERPADTFRDALRALNFSLEVALSDRTHLSFELIEDIEELRGWFQGRRLPLDTQAVLMDYFQALLAFDDGALSEAGIDRAAIQAEWQKLVDGFREG